MLCTSCGTENRRFQLGSDKARSAQARFLIAPVENRTCPFEGIRLNTFGRSSWKYHEASVLMSSAPREDFCGQLARSLGTFVSLFPKARGLRLQSSSWCTRRSRAPTVESEEVGRSGPLSVRSIKRLVQFSRKPLSCAAPAWHHRWTRPGRRWIRRTQPNSLLNRLVAYLRPLVLRHRLATLA